MKRNYAIAILLAFSLLTGCAKQAVPASDTVDVPTETETSAESTESASETEAETTPPPTAPPVKHEQPEGAVLSVREKIEVYEQLTVSDLFTDTNVQLTNGDEPLDTSKTGNLTTAIAYTYEDEQYEHSLQYTVSDTTPPLMLNGGWGSEVELGDTFDLTEHIGFADNYDPKPMLTYTGQVDTSVCGSYPLRATVTDSSGNVTSWELSIKVVEEAKTYQTSSPALTFDTLMQDYAGENVQFGIDVSKWQQNIDFEAVKNAGCDFVMMRMGYFYDEIAMDQYYLQNMERAKAAGLDVGVYIYTTANTEEEARMNARWIVEHLNGQELDFPVVFDWESFSHFQQYEMSIHDLNMLFLAFADELEQSGYSAMLYSSRNFLQNFWYEQKEYPVWLAHYTRETDYEGEYVMWQMSSKGRIHGITGDVDLNILYTDKW